MKNITTLIEEHFDNDAPDFMDEFENEILEMFETGSACIVIDGVRYELSVTLKEID